MEIVQAFAAFFLVIAVVGAVLQVVFGYSLQVISEKNELPDFASFLSWIPLLQLYPFIRVGGGDFKLFLIGGIGGTIGISVLAAISVAALGDAGSIVAGLAIAAFAIAVVVYFARIAMATAERRGLSKWIGLLSFVPLANFFVYPYIAFHDGFRPPNKVGALLGLLMAFGPLPGQITMMNQITQQADELTQADAGGGVTLQQAMGGLGAAMEIGTQLAMLDGMDPADPDQARMMREALGELRGKVDQNRAALGEEAAAEMDRMLDQQEQRLASRAGAGSAAATPAPAAVPPAAPGAVPATPPQQYYEPPTLSVRPPLTDGIARNGDQGFAVPSNPPCPPGTQARGAAPPEGTRTWCEKVGRDAGIKHGWMTEYHPNGQPAAAGEYRDGLRVGVWSRFYDSGVLRVQAQFEDGLQHGVLLSWNPDGSLAYEKYFSQGAPASR